MSVIPRSDWGNGQVQSIKGQIVTVTFEEMANKFFMQIILRLSLSRERQNRPEIDKTNMLFLVTVHREISLDMLCSK